LPALFAKKTGSAPSGSKTFQPRLCGLISINVIVRDSFKFNKRPQLFIRRHNETLSVAAMRVSNKDFWPTLLTSGRAFFNCALGS
jgi:hypothetical protein